jgi:small subunit ribosomal protein S5
MDTQTTTPVTPTSAAPVAAASTAPARTGGFSRGANRTGGANRGGADKRGGKGRDSRGPRRERSEFDQKIIDIRRVTRVTSGGRRMSFSVAVVIGDRRGRVGVGIGKSGDTAQAIDKAARDAKKSMLKLNLTKNNSIPFEIGAKYSSARVEMRPAKGQGLGAGSSVRAVLELAGVNDVRAKLISGTKNGLNNARAAIKALEAIGTYVPLSQSFAPKAVVEAPRAPMAPRATMTPATPAAKK